MKKALIAASLLLISTASHAYTLDFGDAPPSPTICSSSTSRDGSGGMITCSSFDRINQSYGDVAGVVDVTYSANPLTASSLRTLQWWASGYNDLYGIAFAEGGNPTSHARIELKALGGNTIDVTHFDFGAYSNTTRDTTIDVYEIGSTTSLFNYTGPVGLGATTHASFNPLLAPSSVGFWIEWKNTAYDVGIDNIDFDVAAVIPEPETYAMLMAGLGLLGFVARRRKMRLAA